MIRAILRTENKTEVGTLELVERWQGDATANLWLDIEDTPGDQVNQLLLSFGCDPLAIKDAFRDRHPPKLEEFDNQAFLLFRGISALGQDLELKPQQLAFFVGDRCLISFHRGGSVSLSHFWDLASEDPELLSDIGSLTQQILHYACGRYLESVLDFEDRLGELEEILLSDSAEDAMKQLVSYRSRLRVLRRVFNYHLRLSEMIMNSSSKFFGSGDENRHQKRDLYDRCERLDSLCNMFYEICGDLLEGHISLSSHRLNNTMKILTIITAIFVPLSFLAGVYGMNFEHMPELGFRNSYFILLGVMASAVTGMLILFRKLRWL